MGDIADEHIERFLMGDYPGRAGRSRCYGPRLACKYCGSIDVYWQKVKGEHQLFDMATITRHRCPPKDVTSEFDVVG